MTREPEFRIRPPKLDPLAQGLSVIIISVTNIKRPDALVPTPSVRQPLHERFRTTLPPELGRYWVPAALWTIRRWGDRARCRVACACDSGNLAHWVGHGRVAASVEYGLVERVIQARVEADAL